MSASKLTFMYAEPARATVSGCAGDHDFVSVGGGAAIGPSVLTGALWCRANRHSSSAGASDNETDFKVVDA